MFAALVCIRFMSSKKSDWLVTRSSKKRAAAVGAAERSSTYYWCQSSGVGANLKRTLAIGQRGETKRMKSSTKDSWKRGISPKNIRNVIFRYSVAATIIPFFVGFWMQRLMILTIVDECLAKKGCLPISV